MNLDHCAHPRVNAALELMRSDREFGASRCRAFLSSASRDEDDRREVQALGRRNGITGNAIQIRDKSAAKLGYFSKGMHLATAILDERRAADVEQHIAWLIAPLVRVLGCFEFRDELVQGGVAVTDAGAVAEHRVEADGLTVV